MSSTGN